MEPVRIQPRTPFLALIDQGHREIAAELRRVEEAIRKKAEEKPYGLNRWVACLFLVTNPDGRFDCGRQLGELLRRASAVDDIWSMRTVDLDAFVAEAVRLAKIIELREITPEDFRLFHALCLELAAWRVGAESETADLPPPLATLPAQQDSSTAPPPGEPVAAGGAAMRTVTDVTRKDVAATEGGAADPGAKQNPPSAGRRPRTRALASAPPTSPTDRRTTASRRAASEAGTGPEQNTQDAGQNGEDEKMGSESAAKGGRVQDAPQRPVANADQASGEKDTKSS